MGVFLLVETELILT